MRFLKLAKKNGEQYPGYLEQVYEYEVIRRIRAKYSINQELAILRQRDTKVSEFEEYNAYVERVKAEVKSEMQISDKEGQ